MSRTLPAAACPPRGACPSVRCQQTSGDRIGLANHDDQQSRPKLLEQPFRNRRGDAAGAEIVAKPLRRLFSRGSERVLDVAAGLHEKLRRSAEHPPRRVLHGADLLVVLAVLAG